MLTGLTDLVVVFSIVKEVATVIHIMAINKGGNPFFK
jgi:hypothetical protein